MYTIQNRFFITRIPEKSLSWLNRIRAVLFHPPRFAMLYYSRSRPKRAMRRLADSREPSAWIWSSRFNAKPVRRSRIGKMVLTMSSEPTEQPGLFQRSVRRVPSRLVRATTLSRRASRITTGVITNARKAEPRNTNRQVFIFQKSGEHN